MKILTHGKPQPKPTSFQGQCNRCNAIVEHDLADAIFLVAANANSFNYDGTYHTICPTDGCTHHISFKAIYK